MYDPRFDTAVEIRFGTRTVRCYVNRPRSIGAIITACARDFADYEALVDESGRCTYRELQDRSLRVASLLQQHAVKPGDRVAMLMSNRRDFVVAMLGIVALGAIAVPVNVRESASGLEHILDDCGAGGLIIDAEFLNKLDPDVPGGSGRCVLVAGGEDDTTPPFSSFDGYIECTPANGWCQGEEEDVAVLLYTSGTTGAPKGAMLTHVNIIHTALHFEEHWQLRPHDCAILAVPASHVTGLVAMIATTLNIAGKLVLMAEFRVDDFLRLAREEKMAWTILVPAMYKLCLMRGDMTKAQLDSWRIGGFGGAPMPESTVLELGRDLPHLELLNAYGSTECTSVVAATRPGDSASSAWSVGQAVRCCEIKVMIEGRPVPPGIAGEVWLKGPNTVPGYWQNPHRTRTEFVDGYWRSGDLGTLDENGYLILHDRIDDVINRGGYKIYGVEVENVISGMPGVIEAAVLAEADPVLGQKTRAVIYRSEVYIDADAVYQHCRLSLADYKLPDIVEFVDAPLPRNANGKLLKRLLARS